MDLNKLDYNAIKLKFGEICPDFNKPIDVMKGYQSLDFAQEMINDVSKEVCELNKQSSHKTWDFHFVQGIVFVTTDKKVKENQEVSKNEGENVLIMMVDEANLIAVEMLNKLVKLTLEDVGFFLFLPSTKDIFTKNGVKRLSKYLNKSIIDTIKMINVCAQEGGHLLDDSDASVAIVIWLDKTKGSKDQKTIIEKLKNKYIEYEKIPDEEKVKEISKFTASERVADIIKAFENFLFQFNKN